MTNAGLKLWSSRSFIVDYDISAIVVAQLGRAVTEGITFAVVTVFVVRFRMIGFGKYYITGIGVFLRIRFVWLTQGLSTIKNSSFKLPSCRRKPADIHANTNLGFFDSF